MFQHAAGFAHGHFAGQERRHFLHTGRIARRLLQAQKKVGRKTPLPALATITARAPQSDRAKAALKAPRVLGAYVRTWVARF